MRRGPDKPAPDHLTGSSRLTAGGFFVSGSWLVLVGAKANVNCCIRGTKRWRRIARRTIAEDAVL